MAYLLRFDGVNDRVAVPEIQYQANDIIEIVFSGYTGANGDNRYLIDSETNNNSFRPFIIARTDGKIQFNTNNFSSLTIDGLPASDRSANFPADGLDHTVVATISSNDVRLGRIGSRLNDVNNWNADIKSVRVIRSGVTLNFYDPSASNGTGQILPDTAGSNDGTLVNFPTDDSQWIFYDDGGGAVTADTAYTVNAPTFTSSASVTLPAPIANASFTLAAPTFTASADASLPQPIADAAFTLNAPTFSASATATIPGFSASVAYSVSAPTFAADAAVTLPNPTADVDYTVTAPTFSVDSTVTLPQPTANTAFSLPAPTFAASATATEPGFNAAVNFTLPAPTFSADATATLPQPIADGNFTITAPTFSVVAIVGGIAIIVDNETNINMPALSTNINAPVLSNNVRI